MPGSFDLPNVPTQVANQALPIVVAVYTPGAGVPYQILPNVRCLRIDYREGPEPSAARFQYLTGDALQATLGWPAQFEALWPINAAGFYAVDVDTRLVVMTFDPAGNIVVLFDGFAQIPQVDVDKNLQGVSFVAVGVAARLWDAPIVNRVQRNGGQAAVTDGSQDIVINAPARFNPADSSVGAIGGYIGNAVSRANASVDLAGNHYQVFIDPLLIERGAGANLTAYWTTKDALCYLLETQPNPVDASLAPYVQLPSFTTLSTILTTWAAPPGSPLGPGSASPSHLRIRDYDATTKAVPEVFADLLGYFGLTMVFSTNQTASGLPLTQLQILRRDSFAVAKPKPLFLDVAGAALNLAGNNVAAIHLARDTNALTNDWLVETHLQQVEVTVYLAPLFEPVAGDALTPQNFYNTALTNATGSQRRAYRWYGVDECGDGHWNASTGAFNVLPMDFSDVFEPLAAGIPSYVQRYRPGSRKLISRDAEGKPLKAILEIQRPAISDDPSVATVNPADKWYTITHGWQLLDDRLGIEVTIENPDDWQTGNPALPVIRGITDQAAAVLGVNSFRLRLTTVIDADQALDINAPRRDASPTQFIRQRCADGKDHFQYCELTPFSLYYIDQGGDGVNPLALRDDTIAATAHAVQLRSAHEFPILAGSVMIPFLTDFYQIGDQINLISGRTASLEINVGAALGEKPCYPWVTSFSWILEHDRQETVIQLSDRRAEPQRI